MDIRASQYIYTYGPGSILETRSGPGIIMRADMGFFSRDRSATSLRSEIYDTRASQFLSSLTGKRNCLLFMPPTKEMLESRNAGHLKHALKPFPRWRICTKESEHSTHGDEERYDTLFTGKECPVCQNEGAPIRLIQACKSGHMTDVNWAGLVRGHLKDNCNRKWFKWVSKGPLKDTYIQCSSCGKSSRSIGDYWSFGLPYKCSGNYLEREQGSFRPTDPECQSQPRLIQRQSSGIRVPEILTVFSIPPRHTEVGKVLQHRDIQTFISSLSEQDLRDKKRFLSGITNLHNRGKISDEDFHYLSYNADSNWSIVRDAIEDNLDFSGTPDMQEALDEEFRRLVKGSEEGIPPVRSARAEDILFEINPNEKRKLKLFRDIDLYVQPVSKLRATAIQLGYTRYVNDNDSTPPKMVDISFPDQVESDTYWYPAVEVLGEGLFFYLSSNGNLDSSSPAFQNWLRTMNESGSYDERLFRTPKRYELDPHFGWWHTISHASIRALSEVSGYPSSTIRERIYYTGGNSLGSGGFILYTVRTGADGSMGGLRSISRNIDLIGDRIRQQIQICSGDPICSENSFGHGKYVGASCYACLMISETSCDHRNMWLDRSLVLENS